MNKLLSASLILACAFTAPAVHASDTFYVGAGIGTRGTLHVATPAGTRDNTNHPRPFKAFGGYEFTDTFALEAGYTDFGKYKFPVPGTIDIKSYHVVAKGSMKLGESWALFAKAGAAHTMVSHDGMAREDMSETRPMLGIGAEYLITKDLALGLELVNYGTLKSPTSKLNMRQAQASLRYSF